MASSTLHRYDEAAASGQPLSFRLAKWVAKSQNRGRTPARSGATIRVPALLAQLVEHLHGKEGVDGSSPSEGFRHERRRTEDDLDPHVVGVAYDRHQVPLDLIAFDTE